MKFNKIPLIIYSFALNFAIALGMIINISGNYLNESNSLLLKNILLGIVLIGAVFGLINNIRINNKRKRYLYIMLIVGLIFCILSNLTIYSKWLESILYWIEVITAMAGYLLIIIFIVFLFITNKSSNSK